MTLWLKKGGECAAISGTTAAARDPGDPEGPEAQEDLRGLRVFREREVREVFRGRWECRGLWEPWAPRGRKDPRVR